MSVPFASRARRAVFFYPMVKEPERFPTREERAREKQRSREEDRSRARVQQQEPGACSSGARTVTSCSRNVRISARAGPKPLRVTDLAYRDIRPMWVRISTTHARPHCVWSTASVSCGAPIATLPSTTPS